MDMLEGSRAAGRHDAGVAVEVLDAGDGAKGEFRCVGCGYGAAVWTELPACPMCGGTVWQRVGWRPFLRPGRDAEPGRL